LTRPPAPFRENLRGIAAITVCNFLFLINDTLIKLAADEMPLGEILFVRGAFATLFIGAIVLASGAQRAVHQLRHPAMFWRTVAEVAAAILFLLGVIHIPIATANVILQVVPLTLTAAGALFLGEAVGWRRWLAIVVGFAGVLVIVRPGLSGFSVYALIALAGVLFITLRDVCTRLMPHAVPALLIALVTAIAVGASGPVVGLALGERWVLPTADSLLLIVSAVLFLTGGYLAAVAFMRHGDIAVVAPFRYTVVIWAMIVGYLVWGDVPDALTLTGTAIIIFTGVYTFHRERRVARLAEEAAAGEGL
jgi:drug/metabolite transporter (DMT)-like permease